MSLWIVFLAALLTAIATGLGALPFLAIREVSQRVMGWASAAAGGMMFAACYSLIAEGVTLDVPRLLLGILFGLVVVAISQRLLGEQHEPQLADLSGADARKALLILGIMTVHSFAEGVGVGVSFAGREGLGTFITTAIALHNVPEGLAIALVLIPMGMPVWKAALWAIFTSLPQPIMAVPAYLFVETFRDFLPVGLGLAAGAMIWMVVAEMIPDAAEKDSSESAATALTLAFTGMMAVQLLLLGN